MTRNLTIFIAVTTALAAFGALSATSHAAEERFHCSVEPCTWTLAPDGTPGAEPTAHHVFVVKGPSSSATFTCDQLAGEATSLTKTPIELTFTNLKYENAKGESKCKVGASETVEINFTSCDYNIKSLNGSTSTAAIHVLCTKVGDAIDVNIKGTLCLQVTPFTSTGLGYHAGGSPHQIMTATVNVAIPAAAVDLKNVGNANCAALGLTSVTAATYTTGNTLIKTETHGGLSAEAWFE